MLKIITMDDLKRIADIMILRKARMIDTMILSKSLDVITLDFYYNFSTKC